MKINYYFGSEVYMIGSLDICDSQLLTNSNVGGGGDVKC